MQIMGRLLIFFCLIHLSCLFHIFKCQHKDNVPNNQYSSRDASNGRSVVSMLLPGGGGGPLMSRRVPLYYMSVSGLTKQAHLVFSPETAKGGEQTTGGDVWSSSRGKKLRKAAEYGLPGTASRKQEASKRKDIWSRHHHRLRRTQRRRHQAIKISSVLIVPRQYSAVKRRSETRWPKQSKLLV